MLISFVFEQEEIPSIVDCPDPDHMTPRERRIGRIAHEEAAFSEDHYLLVHLLFRTLCATRTPEFLAELT